MFCEMNSTGQNKPTSHIRRLAFKGMFYDQDMSILTLKPAARTTSMSTQFAKLKNFSAFSNIQWIVDSIYKINANVRHYRRTSL